ncbi:hypothetical protein MOPEL_134_00230 [Mobilicoccus pelagius NBRC 104925]|uniref:Uncharacterized protein n=1 Tax=Mobilicoccus pelagius NBRC 104925 TaxID=1089455 RepID=H5UVI1_9MICO|nr:hypothetical protein MOPEL_134_00230 [Mobilicoccus pelagius NBRC 104925]
MERLLIIDRPAATEKTETKRTNMMDPLGCGVDASRRVRHHEVGTALSTRFVVARVAGSRSDESIMCHVNW